MSIVPLLLNVARELDTDVLPYGDFDDFFDDDFGFGIHPIDIFRPPRTSLMLHPRRRSVPYDRRQALIRRGSAGRAGGRRDDMLMPVVGKDGFQVCMDVSKFKPNELTVKTVDNTIVVEGKHEDREDEHGTIQRHFVRKYTLPKDYDSKEVVSTISSDGVLTINAPPPASKSIKQNERIVQIQQTGPAHLSVKAPEQHDAKDQSQNGGPVKQNSNMDTGK